MNASAHPTFALRPYLPEDAPLVIAIYRESIVELTGDDYSEQQREAWASAADDEDAFAEARGAQLTLIGTVNGSAAGFASLADNAKIDMLYVHPVAAGEGLGTMLCDALERLAASRGAKDLTVDASDNAEGFFAARGFVATQRNSVLRGDEWLSNTTMKKALAAQGAT